tara:strand:- start:199 stop:1386 length:1188 start_codon:yes stop_codon:yes gene_type:complete
MGVKVTNNAFGTISTGINTSATTIVLDSGQGARFPTLGSGDYFYATLIDTSNTLEIVKVTARSTDSMTVTRAQDNTTASAFAIGDRFELRPTAALFEDIVSNSTVVSDTSPQLGGNLDLNSNNINDGTFLADSSRIRIPNASSDPSSPNAGDMYYNTTSKLVQHYDGTKFVQMSNIPLDGSSAALAPQYGSDVINALGGSFSAGLYYLTGLTTSGFSAQQVYVDADGYMLFYRHAGTGSSYNSTYEITGDALGEVAIGTLTSPTMGLTTTGVSTAAGSRGMARLATDFVRALGGESASGNVIRMTVGSNTVYITDAQWYATAPTGSGDTYGYDNSISYGNSYANRRATTSFAHDSGRPLSTYPGYNVIPYYHGNGYSGGYDGAWSRDTTIWVRQY